MVIIQILRKTIFNPHHGKRKSYKGENKLLHLKTIYHIWLYNFKD